MTIRGHDRLCAIMQYYSIVQLLHFYYTLLEAGVYVKIQSDTMYIFCHAVLATHHKSVRVQAHLSTTIYNVYREWCTKKSRLCYFCGRKFLLLMKGDSHWNSHVLVCYAKEHCILNGWADQQRIKSCPTPLRAKIRKWRLHRSKAHQNQTDHYFCCTNQMANLS